MEARADAPRAHCCALPSDSPLRCMSMCSIEHLPPSSCRRVRNAPACITRVREAASVPAPPRTHLIHDATLPASLHGVRTGSERWDAAHVPTRWRHYWNVHACAQECVPCLLFKSMKHRGRRGRREERCPSLRPLCFMLLNRSTRGQRAAIDWPELRRIGSRKAAIRRAAVASRCWRSGISLPPKGSGTSKPSPARRGIRCTW